MGNQFHFWPDDEMRVGKGVWDWPWNIRGAVENRAWSQEVNSRREVRKQVPGEESHRVVGGQNLGCLSRGTSDFNGEYERSC